MLAVYGPRWRQNAQDLWCDRLLILLSDIIKRMMIISVKCSRHRRDVKKLDSTSKVVLRGTEGTSKKLTVRPRSYKVTNSATVAPVRNNWSGQYWFTGREKWIEYVRSEVRGPPRPTRHSPPPAPPSGSLMCEIHQVGQDIESGRDVSQAAL